MDLPFAFTVRYVTKAQGEVLINIKSSAPYLDPEEMIERIRRLARIEIPEKPWDWEGRKR